MAQAADKAASSGDVTLLGFEYDRLITLGLRANEQFQEMVFCSETPIYKINRGGLATLHNKGQAIIYPVTAIKKMGFSTRQWVEFVSRVTAQSLSKCNIIIESQNYGIFSNKGKISSIGFSLKKGISTHGVSINVCNDLTDFKKIIPCGSRLQQFDKVSHYVDRSTEDVFHLWCEEFMRELAHSLSGRPRVYHGSVPDDCSANEDLIRA